VSWGRDIIQASAREGVAAQQPPQRQPQPAQRTVRGDGHGRILRAGGLVAASAGREDMECRREPAAVEAESCEQEARHRAAVAEGGRSTEVLMCAASVFAC
jgi:hypothetical protein